MPFVSCDNLIRNKLGYEHYSKNQDQKYGDCHDYLLHLRDLLNDKYELVLAGLDVYLVPKGTANQITYYGKPEGSFRLSDHWNWYYNDEKCPDPDVVQCLNVDVPPAFIRYPEDGLKTTKPRFAIQVAKYEHGKYHCLHGEFFDKKSQMWCWAATDVVEDPTYYTRDESLYRMTGIVEDLA